MKSIRIKAALFTLLMAACGGVFAQAWPSRPVRIIVPVGAGTFGDILARLVSDELQAVFKQPFTVENKAGASGIIAAEFVAKSAPDGYTLLIMTNSAHSANPHLFKKLPYEPVKDFAAIARICYVPFLLVVAQDSPIQSLGDLVARAKTNPGKLAYGYGNTTGQVAAAALATLAGVNLVAVAYKTTPQAMTEVVGGRVDFMFTDAGSSAALLKSGRLRAIAVTSEKRSALLPEVPTVEEGAKLPGYSVAAWAGLGAPAGLPGDIATKISNVLLDLIGRRNFAEKLHAMGAEPAPAPAAEFNAYLGRQLETWGQKIKEASIEPQ